MAQKKHIDKTINMFFVDFNGGDEGVEPLSANLFLAASTCLANFTNISPHIAPSGRLYA